MQIIPANTKIDFMSKGKFAFAASLLFIAFSVFYWFQLGDKKYGIDFRGGYEIIVKMDPKFEEGSEAIRKALDTAGIKNAVVQAFEVDSKEYSIRLGGERAEPEVIAKSVAGAMATFPGENSVIGNEYVGPTIGNELRRNALIAIIVGLIVMLGYITYRFDFAFALGAVAALFHDVIVCMGIYLLAGRTLNMAALAATLTIVGYSVNDTIIVFDRMREEANRRKEYDVLDLMNSSINSTLSRTVITSLLTLFSAVALLLYGGGAISDLSLFLVVGVITGTYSTIFIASPVAYLWERSRKAPVVESASVSS